MAPVQYREQDGSVRQLNLGEREFRTLVSGGASWEVY